MTALNAGETLKRIDTNTELILDASNNVVGLRNKNANGLDLRANLSYSAATGLATTPDGVSVILGGIPGTFATSAALQTAYPAASNAGKSAIIGTGAPYFVYDSDGNSWSARTKTLLSSAVSMVLQSSGSITNGVLSGLTAVDHQYNNPGCWMYFPTGAALPSGAGWYWVIMSSGTAGQIYTAYQATTGNVSPTVPANQVAIVSGGSAYTQTINTDIRAACVTMPANSLGLSGYVTQANGWTWLSSAGLKLLNMNFGAAGSSDLEFGVTTGGATMGGIWKWQNKGVAGKQNQTAGNAGWFSGNPPASSTDMGAVSGFDTTGAGIIASNLNIAVATDWAALQSTVIQISPQ